MLIIREIKFIIDFGQLFLQHRSHFYEINVTDMFKKNDPSRRCAFKMYLFNTAFDDNFSNFASRIETIIFHEKSY